MIPLLILDIYQSDPLFSTILELRDFRQFRFYVYQSAPFFSLDIFTSSSLLAIQIFFSVYMSDPLFSAILVLLVTFANLNFMFINRLPCFPPSWDVFFFVNIRLNHLAPPLLLLKRFLLLINEFITIIPLL